MKPLNEQISRGWMLFGKTSFGGKSSLITTWKCEKLKEPKPVRISPFLMP